MVSQRSRDEQDAAAPRWQNHGVVSINRRLMHAPLRAFETAQQALGRSLTEDEPTSSWVLPLSPARWAFRFQSGMEDLPITRPGAGFDTATWDDIHVPWSWELAGHGQPIYTNIRYPFPLDPPRIPNALNQVGCYQTNFAVPSSWTGRRVYLQLDGVDSACTVWIDGIEVGYSQDSRLPAEFDVTDACEKATGRVEGPHVLSVQVLRWCDGSYLEDQDHWWLSGIHRHVRVYSKPSALAISDYQYTSAVAADGTRAQLEVRVGLIGSAAVAAASGDTDALQGWRIAVSLHGPMRLLPGVPPSKGSVAWSAQLPVELLDAQIDQQCHAAEEEAGMLHGDVGASFRCWLHAPSLWTAETPNLYTLLVQLWDADGRVVDVEACWAGMRSVSTEHGLLRVNGMPITVRGVNRHEHCAESGKAVSWETMLTDARLMKQLNFNAVRCSHYPNCQRWYELCDALGLYVVDEANIETHGFTFAGDEGMLSKTPSWRHAFMSRLCRMVRRDKNHACIIVWSLGNESGYGPTHEAMADWCRTNDPSRAVQYESCGGMPCTDIICPMYPPWAVFAQMDTVAGQCAASHCGPMRYWPRATHTNQPRPIILCEYAHAMGNSSGNLDEWWDAFRSMKHAQGGFLWDWVDQGLVTCDDRGTTFFGYGGDFYEELHDAQFCINGILFPDRSVHPAAWQIKHVQRPVEIALSFCQDTELQAKVQPPDTCVAAHGGAATLIITNRYDFLSLDHLRISCGLEVGGVELAVAAVHKIAEFKSLGPGESVVLIFDLEPTPDVVARLPADAFLTVKVMLANSTSWASEGHEVSCQQFPLPQLPVLPPLPLSPSSRRQSARLSRRMSIPGVFSRAGLASSWATDVGETEIAAAAQTELAPHPLRCREDADGFSIVGCRDGEEFSLRVSRFTGAVHSFRISGSVVVDEGPELQLWRAPTDNDQGCAFSAITRPLNESVAIMPSRMSLALKMLRRLPSKMSGVVHALVAFGLVPSELISFESWADMWRQECLHDLHRKVTSLQLQRQEAGRVVLLANIEMHTAAGVLRATHELTIIVLAHGEVLLVNDVTAFSQLPSLPRMGLHLALPQSLGEVEWYGRGPHENYSDRSSGAMVGVYSSTVDDMFTPYVFPSENAHRGDVRWLCMRSSKGEGVHVSGSSTFGFSASRFSALALERAMHPHELEPEPCVHLSVDQKHMGVGGDTAWTRSVLPRYFVQPGTYQWAIRLRPFSANSAVPPQGTTLPPDLRDRLSTLIEFEPLHVRGGRRLLTLIVLPVAVLTVVLSFFSLQSLHREATHWYSLHSEAQGGRIGTSFDPVADLVMIGERVNRRIMYMYHSWYLPACAHALVSELGVYVVLCCVYVACFGVTLVMVTNY